MRAPHLLLLLPLLAACAASAPTWDKAGASESAIAEDLQRCRVAARSAPPPSLFATPTPQSGTPMMDRGQERDAQEDRQIRDCMQGRGYSLKR
jgi:hypothetical protein